MARTRRPHDADASRQALLDAASVLFDERGYDQTTVRDIGEAANIEPALIMRYFGSKEGLYLATLSREGRPPMPADMQAALTEIVSRAEIYPAGPYVAGVLSLTLTDAMREQIQLWVARRVEPLVDELRERGVDDAPLRVELLIALSLGVSLARASGTLPALADVSLDELFEVMAPLVDALQREGRQDAP